MKELLFENNIEKEALENLLAFNQINKCNKEIEKYTNEIKEQNDEIKKILNEQGIEVNYIEKIEKYKTLLKNIDGENGRIGELNSIIEENEKRIADFQARIEEIEDKLESLKKEIFETDEPSRVIECQNEIENNNIRLNDLNNILSQLISDNTPLLIEKEYLMAKNGGLDFNFVSFDKTEIKDDLEQVTAEYNTMVESLELTVRENLEFCEKKIKNREIEIEKFTERKNNVIDSYPNSVNLDIEKAKKDLENLLCELDLYYVCECVQEKNIFDEEEPEIVEETKEEVVEPTEVVEEDIKEEISNLSEEPEIVEETKEEKAEEVKEPEVVEEVVTEKEETTQTNDNEIGSVSYVLSEGESLSNIAEKVYPSKDNWEAIYYFNKETIDKYLVSNGISNDFDTVKEVAEDTNLFTGIKLEIPTDYNYKI